MTLKTSHSTNHSTQGHVLAMVLVVVTICAIALMSYLQLVNSQNRAVARSQGWNSAVPVMEAGVEEALAHLNANVDNLNVDGWVRIGNYYRMERSVGEKYYVVTIHPTNAAYPIIESRGFCRMPMLVQNTGSPFFMAQAGMNYGGPRQGYMGRGVRITAKRNNSMIKALLAKDSIRIGGNVSVDSYDSCDPAKNSGGRYDPTKAGEGGDIASNGKLINEITASGSVDIRGHISTGPGGTIGINGNNVSIGSDSWVDSDRTGIEPGWFRDDMNANIADSPPPPPLGFTHFPTGGTVNGVAYDHILTAGSYTIGNASSAYNMPGTKKILITGDVSIHFPGGLSMSGNDAIHISPTGNLQVWGGGIVKIAGQGLLNNTGDPQRFKYYGTKSNNRVELSGTSAFIGTIYAPYAEFSPAGGSVIHGAVVSKSVRATGGFTLHYDQCLGGNNSKARFILTGWHEMTPPEVAQVP
jgi:hypothetical protein